MNERTILSKMYYDVADVYRIGDIEDKYGMSVQKRQKVYENIRCALSMKTLGNINVSDMSNEIKSSYTLFVSDETDIKSSDIIYIKNHNKYFKAGEVFKYPNSHSEITLSKSEKV